MTTIRLRAALAALAAAATVACSSPASPAAPSPSPAPVWPVRIALQEHESQVVPQTDLLVTLDDVQLSVTSCLPNVPCPAFLAGVTIGVRAPGGGAVTRTTFYAWDGAPPASLRAVHHGYVVRFVNLTPPIGFATPPQPYRVELEVAPE